MKTKHITLATIVGLFVLASASAFAGVPLVSPDVMLGMAALGLILAYVVASWAGIVREDGLRTGDLADAMAAYWILNWIMANQGDNNRTQALAVRDQVRGVIGGSPAVARLGDAGRQEMAEVLMLNFLVQQATYVDAMQRGDQAMMRRLGDAAVARFRNEMGVDLRRLQLTDAGLVSAS